MRGVQLVELRLGVDGLLEAGEELLLELVDLLDVPEQRADLPGGEEALLLERLQVGLHQEAEVAHVGVLGVHQLADDLKGKELI